MGRNQVQTGTDQRMIGKIIAGRYSLVRMLGDGGMGAVYKAEDNVLRRFVAIKLLHPAAAANPAAVERFLREAQAAASIGHPNIIDILDFGEADSKPYLVMEYLRGRSLADAIHTDGPQAVKEACSITTHALAGLQAAHDRGILHRDLKPANLMLVVRFGDRAFVKLLDFGFAALLGGNLPTDKSLTPARTLVGTPAYAAPERLRGDDRRDPRTDLYSLGVVLYEMLAGVRPFDAPTFSELARKVQNDSPPPLRLYRPDAPDALERVIVKALSKNPDDRYPDAESFAAALVPFGGHVVEVDDGASDSLTMDLIKIRARDKKREPPQSGRPSADAVEKRKPAVEVNAVVAPSSTDIDLDSIAVDRDKLGRVVAPAPAEPKRPSAPPPALPSLAKPPEALPAPPMAQGRGLPPAVRAAGLPVPSVKPGGLPPLAAPRAGLPLPGGKSVPPPRMREGLKPEAPTAADTLRTQPSLVAPGGPRTAPVASSMRPPETGMSRAPVPTAREPNAGSTSARPPAAGMPAIPGPPALPGAHTVTAPRKQRHAPATRAFDANVSLSILRFVSRRYGERALKTVLDNLPPDARHVFSAGVSPGTWMAFESVTKLVEVIDAKLGRDDLHLVADCGRAVAEGTFEQMKRLGPPMPPPELLLAEMPGFVEALVRGIECKVRSVGRGYGRLEVDEFDHEPSLTTCVLILGFLDRSLSRFGAREVEVNLLNSRYLGDDENLFDISWLIT